MERWQAAEDARVERLAVFAPLDGVIDLPLTLDRLAAVDDAAGDIEVRNRIGRLRTILSADMSWLLDELKRLKVPTPMPSELPEMEPES